MIFLGNIYRFLCCFPKIKKKKIILNILIFDKTSICKNFCTKKRVNYNKIKTQLAFSFLSELKTIFIHLSKAVHDTGAYSACSNGVH